LKKTKTATDAAVEVGVARDSLFAWATRYGYGDIRTPGTGRRKNADKTPKKYKTREPQLVNLHVAPPPVEKKKGTIVVMMGDVDSVKEALQSAFNVVTK
jgi:hypothetical protein